MCLAAGPGYAPYSNYYKSQAPNSPFVQPGNFMGMKAPGGAAIMGAILAKKQGAQIPGAATQPVKQFTGG